MSPATHAKIVEAFIEAGLPSGVLNSIQASWCLCLRSAVLIIMQVRREDAVAVTEALIADTRIRKIAFIGSAAVGKIIAATAGTYLKPVLMELGGKCPAIVCDDADLDKAAMLCAKGGKLVLSRGNRATKIAKIQSSNLAPWPNMLLDRTYHCPSRRGISIQGAVTQCFQSIEYRRQYCRDHGHSTACFGRTGGRQV